MRLIFRRPSVPTGPGRALPPADAAPGQLRVTFLGVSTLLFHDGETAVLTDGFFTRPGLLRTLGGRIAPDSAVVDACLARAGVTELAAVVVLHSHYDHVLDAPTVAARTGAVLVGSDSTAQVGRGAGLPGRQVTVPEPDVPLRFGRFRLTVRESAHVPPHRFVGRIAEPLVPPARAAAYRMGECYSLLVEHGSRSLLVQGSAGHRPGALAGWRADVAYLGVGTLGRQPAAYRGEYWTETVTAVGARRVLPIHWDDFWRPLDRPLVPMPLFADDLDATMEYLDAAAERDGVDVRMPTAWQPTDPFAGLTPTRR